MKSWKTTVGAWCAVIGGLIVVVGTWLSGDVSLGDTVPRIIESIGAILGLCGVGIIGTQAKDKDKTGITE